MGNWCYACQKEKNERGFCMSCYERVITEKPLLKWTESKGHKCKRCKEPFAPAQAHYFLCPDCWAKRDTAKRCKGIKVDGGACKGFAQDGHEYCGVHLAQEQVIAGADASNWLKILTGDKT